MATILENTVSLNLNSQIYAWDQIANVYIKWDYNGKFLKVQTGSLDYLLWVPSILASDITSVDIIDIIDNQRLIYKWYSNLPVVYSWSIYNANPVDGFEFEPNQVVLFAWNISDLESDINERTIFLDNLQTNYQWTEIATETSIAEILAVDLSSESISSNYIATVLNNSLKTKIEKIKVTSWWLSWWGSDWTSIDVNCNIPDITVWSQTWAWCNSTLAEGYEYMLKPWYTAYCYDYWPSYWASSWNIWCRWVTTKEIDYFEYIYPSGVNTVWWKWVDNIWWKHYTWDQAMWNIWDWACQNWYHLPSDEEWNILETNLGSTDTSTIWYRSDWLWWSWNWLKTHTDNLVNALLLPLAWWYRSDNWGMDFRWQRLNMWTSTLSWEEVYYRFMRHDNSWVYRGLIGSLDLWFSVRCIKD
jgi:hypothetical protein